MPAPRHLTKSRVGGGAAGRNRPVRWSAVRRAEGI